MLIYSQYLDLVIHAAHKTGIKKIKQLLEDDSPYPPNLFHQMDDGLTPHARHRIIMVRPHTHRVLSTYYDKIVDPYEQPEGWRLNYSSPSNKFNRYEGYDTFLDFVKSLGLNAHDQHLQPYLVHPDSKIALNKDFGIDQTVLMRFISTRYMGEDLKGVLNEGLKLDPSYAEDWWEKRPDYSMKYSYTKHLPPSSEYGASSWSKVSYEELHRCFQEHKVLPTPDLMYDEETLKWLKSQMGYICDQIYMREFNPHSMDFFRDKGHLFRI
jgi:hypothetical protein